MLINYFIINTSKFQQKLRTGHVGSRWTRHLILRHHLVISEIAPCKGSFYFPLPTELNNSMIGLINIQSDNNECFSWCSFQHLNPVNKNTANVRNDDREFEKNLILKV